MKERLLSTILTFVMVLIFLPTSARAAEDDGFNAKLDIVRGDTKITVTVQDSEVLHEEQPTLTIPCNFSYAKVTHDGKTVIATLENGSISFRVSEGGIYTITKANSSTVPTTPIKPSKPAGETEETEPAEMAYPDVSKADWYYEAVKAVTEARLMGSTGKGFEPNLATSRAMVWTILARMDGKNVDGTGSEWYLPAQKWASENGVSDGTMPNDVITREQFVTMVYRYAKSSGMDVTVGGMALREFEDYEAVSPYAVEAMQWAIGTGIVNGIDGKLVPQGNATRAQTATMLTRFRNLNG